MTDTPEHVCKPSCHNPCLLYCECGEVFARGIISAYKIECFGCGRNVTVEPCKSTVSAETKPEEE